MKGLLIPAIKTMYNAGMTQREIAQRLGRSQKWVWLLMRRYHIKSRDQWGEKNHRWAGSKASVRAMHKRLDRRFGQPQRCDKCGQTDPDQIYEWANLTGQYDMFEDYLRMCRSCHRTHDYATRSFPT